MAENKNIESLPEVRAAVAALSPEDKNLLEAVQESPFRLTTPEQFREFAENVDYFVLEPGIRRLDDLGWSYLEQHMDIPLPPALREAIDPAPLRQAGHGGRSRVLYQPRLPLPFRGRVAA